MQVTLNAQTRTFAQVFYADTGACDGMVRGLAETGHGCNAHACTHRIKARLRACVSAKRDAACPLPTKAMIKVPAMTP